MAAVKPVILLAFANDPADGINYLRNLPEEERTGYMGGQECGSKAKQAAASNALFAPASGTRH